MKLSKKKNKKHTYKWKGLTTLIIIALISLLFTIYVMLNAYEQIFLQDI